VIITGRHKAGRNDHLMGGLDATAAEVTALAGSGGTCTATVCDHDDDTQVEKLVNVIFAVHGRIDVLVNNAYGGADYTGDFAAKSF